MDIILDGYNILKRMYGLEVTPNQKEAYIAFLQKYATKKKHTIHIVFDGGRSEWPTQEKMNTIIVVYSGKRTSADTVIMEHIESKKVGGTLVVTSDRKIISFVRRMHCVAIDGDLFNDYLFCALKQGDSQYVKKKPHLPVIKNNDEMEESEYLDNLMYHYSLQEVPSKEDDEQNKGKMESYFGKKASKYERQIIAILKKL